MSQRQHLDACPSLATRRARLAGVLGWTALALLMALMVGRTMLNETPFQRGPLLEAGAFGELPVREQIYLPVRVARAAALVLVGLAGSAWLAGGWIRGRLQLRAGVGLWAAVGALAALMTLPVLAASDRREAIVTALEQISLLTALLLTVELLDSRARRRALLAVLAAVACALACKAIHQVTVEIPEHRAWFAEHRAAQLASLGVQEGTPEAEMVEARVVEATAKGYMSLANIFGSLMILLTGCAAGLGAQALSAWRAQRRAAADDRREGYPKKRRGFNEIQIPVELAGGVLCLAIALASAAAVALTFSKGAVAALGAAALLAAALWMLRGTVASHRRAVVMIGAALLTAALAAVVGLGLSRGSLPSRSMQVRWEYWRGAAELVRRHPLTGVGPGSFADAYLAVRPLGAEEAVKNPHNLIAQALSEYGLPAGGLYLAILIAVLLRLCRPCGGALSIASQSGAAAPADGATPGILNGESCAGAGRVGWIVLAVLAGALGYKGLLTSYPTAASLIVENVLAVAALPLGALAGLWATRGWATAEQHCPKLLRLGVGCGLAGFALHNLLDFALFMPGAAMAFWMAAGLGLSHATAESASTACGESQTGKAEQNTIKKIAIGVGLVASLLATGLVAVGVLRPVLRAERLGYAAAVEVSASRAADSAAELRQRIDAALELLADAAAADPLDALYPAARASLAAQATAGNPDIFRDVSTLAFARGAAAEALRRKPESVALREQLLRLELWLADDDVLRLPSPAAASRALDDAAAASQDQSSGKTPGRAATAEQLNAAALHALAGPSGFFNKVESDNFNSVYQVGDQAGGQIAAAIYRRAIERYGQQHPVLWSHLGDALALAGRQDEARAAWQRYLAIYAKDSGADLAWRRELGERIEDIARRDPHDSYRRLRLAELAWRLGDPELSAVNATAAEAADAALVPQSVLKFDPAARRVLSLIQQRPATVDGAAE